MKNRLWLVVLICTIVAICMGATGVFAEKAYTPSTNDQFDLGTNKLQYKDIRMGGDIYIEGATHDGYETKITATDPTADRTITLPDSTGTLSLVGGAGGTLADGKMYIGNNVGGGVAVAADISGLFTIVNTGVATGTLADGKIWIGNNVGGGAAVAATMSGDATIANSGALTISASAVESSMIAIANVTATDLFLNTVTATIAAGTTGADLSSIEAGSILIDTQLVSGFSNTYTLNKSIFVGDVWLINTSAHLGSMIMNGVFIRP